MALLRFLLGLAFAIAVHAAGLRWLARFAQVVDPILILVLYHSLRSRPGWDVLGGAVAGLAHDALAGGIFGQFGFVDTVVAALCARLRQSLVIQRSERLGVLFALLALVQEAVLALLRFLLLPGVELTPPWAVLAKMLTTGVLGVAVLVVATRWRSRVAGWRETRRRRLTIEAR